LNWLVFSLSFSLSHASFTARAVKTLRTVPRPFAILKPSALRVRSTRNSAELSLRPRRRSGKRTAASVSPFISLSFSLAFSFARSLARSLAHSLSHSRNKRTQLQYNSTASIYQFFIYIFIYIYIYIIYFFSHIYIHFVFYINNSVLDAFFCSLTP